MNAPTRVRWAALGVAVCVVVLVGPLWLPAFGTALVVDDPPRVADAALVLEGTGADALESAELWRQQGLVQYVVVVEAPLETHALVAYWSDFVRWGLAPPPRTPADKLHVVRAPSTRADLQARAARPVLSALGASSVLAPGGGSIGSRLMRDDLTRVLQRHGIAVRVVRQSFANRDPARWWTDADDRRAVLANWLQILVPGLNA